MSGKNKHRSANDYLQYLKGELSNQERHAIERDLESDPFEREALEGLESLPPEQMEHDLLTLQDRLRKRLSRRRRLTLYSVAASVASLIIVGTVFMKIHDFKPLSAEKQVYPEESLSSPPRVESAPPSHAEEDLSEIKAIESPAKAHESVQEAEEALDFIISEEHDAEPSPDVTRQKMAAPVTPENKSEEEPVSYMEAQPMAKGNEAQAARMERESGQRKKSFDQMLTGKVTGVVISAEDQEPLPGVFIENRALNSGVITDMEGKFDLPAEENVRTTLIASFVGMNTQEFQTSGGTSVELVMQPDAGTLEEVVVLGYVAEGDDMPAGSSFELVHSSEQDGSEHTVAEPSVGFKNYKAYISENIQFPSDQRSVDKVHVVLKFTVTKTGEIKDIVALKSPGDSFTEEAIRLLVEGPSWVPASNDRGTKDQSVRIRFVFK